MLEFLPEHIFVVTGASSGIGEAVTLELNKLGASVVMIARDLQKMEKVKASALHPGRIFVQERDLAYDIGGIPAYVKSLCDIYGKFQGMVCCAGITELRPLRSLDYEDMQKLFAINYFSPILMAKGFADKRVNNGRGSCFIAIASIGYAFPAKATITYSGSKAALVTSIKSIAKEFASTGVRYNTVSPSDIETPMTAQISDIMDKVRGNYPLGFGTPQDVAHVVSFLLSSEARWITGQNYIIDCCSR